MDKEQILGMVSMRLDGATYREIANKFGISHEYVRQNIGGLGGNLSKQARLERQVSKVIYPNIRKWMIETGTTIDLMAEGIHVSRGCLLNGLTGERSISKATIDKILLVTKLTYEDAFQPESAEAENG